MEIREFGSEKENKNPQTPFPSPENKKIQG